MVSAEAGWRVGGGAFKISKYFPSPPPPRLPIFPLNTRQMFPRPNPPQLPNLRWRPNTKMCIRAPKIRLHCYDRCVLKIHRRSVDGKQLMCFRVNLLFQIPPASCVCVCVCLGGGGGGGLLKGHFYVKFHSSLCSHRAGVD